LNNHKQSSQTLFRNPRQPIQRAAALFPDDFSAFGETLQNRPAKVYQKFL